MELTLVRATLLRRYKRFLADVRLGDGTTVIAHVPNTGSMATLLHPDGTAWLLPAANPERKLRWTVVLLATPGDGLAVVDTSLPNRLVQEAIVASGISELAGYSGCRREAAYGSRGSRADFHLSGHRARPDAMIEVKNVTMLGQGDRAEFPDAVSERGQKHLLELADEVHAGRRGVQFYLVDRTDCTRCGIAATIDPVYAAGVRTAASAGVEFLAYRVAIAQRGERFNLSVGQPIAFEPP